MKQLISPIHGKVYTKSCIRRYSSKTVKFMKLKHFLPSLSAHVRKIGIAILLTYNLSAKEITISNSILQENTRMRTQQCKKYEA